MVFLFLGNGDTERSRRSVAAVIGRGDLHAGGANREETPRRRARDRRNRQPETMISLARRSFSVGGSP